MGAFGRHIALLVVVGNVVWWTLAYGADSFAIFNILKQQINKCLALADLALGETFKQRAAGVSEAVKQRWLGATGTAILSRPAFRGTQTVGYHNANADLSMACVVAKLLARVRRPAPLVALAYKMGHATLRSLLTRRPELVNTLLDLKTCTVTLTIYDILTCEILSRNSQVAETQTEEKTLTAQCDHLRALIDMKAFVETCGGKSGASVQAEQHVDQHMGNVMFYSLPHTK